jgi:autotransporter-associated beta strand protein
VINVTGPFTSVGAYPLIDYTTRTGGGNLVLGERPVGTMAVLVTNIANSSIDLEILAIASDLYWTGNVNGDWDIGITPNWDFLSGGAGATTYSENPNTGDYVTFFNGAANPAITLKSNVKPAQMVFYNSSTEYSFSGTAVGIHGSGDVIMAGGGVVTLATSNSFSGGISNVLGFIQAGHNSALGTGPLTLWPSMSGWKNTGLRSDSSSARSIANPIQFRSVSGNELNFQLGDTIRNGKLTLMGPINLSNRRNEISTDSDVEFTGTLSNGCFSKTGPGRLILSGSAVMTVDDNVLVEGDVIVNGGSWSNSTFGLRLVAGDGLVSRLILTNNGIITLAGGSNLRVAGEVEGSFPQGTGTNEFIMYSGELNLIGTSGAATIGNAASLSSLGRIILNGGTVTTRGLRGLPNAGPTELILNGATVRAPELGIATLGNFMSGFTNASILAGGVLIDIPDGVVAVGTQDLQGNGGLTKQGSGMLLLNGANGYTGATLVNAGILGGAGVFSGSVTIGPAGVLSVADGLGTMTINNVLSLGGTTFVEVDKATLASDIVLGVTAANYGGTLVVSNISATPLVGGEVFQLFSVSGARSGNFGSIVVVSETGLGGTFDPTTGQLTITSAAAPPVFAPPAISGGNFILTGTGVPDATYSILTSTNVAAPVSEWATAATGMFSSSGTFSNAIPIGAGARRFFMVQTP